MNKLLIRAFGHDDANNIVVMLYSEDENALRDFVIFNPNSLKAKNLIYKFEDEEPRHITVFVNPFVTLDVFVKELKDSFDGEIYFTVPARQSYTMAIQKNDINKIYSFEETTAINKPVFGS